MKRFLIQLILIVLLGVACRAENGAEQITAVSLPPSVTSPALPPPAVEVAEAASTVIPLPEGSDVADLLQNPPASGESVEIVAYFTNSDALFPMPSPYTPSLCPYKGNAALTDQSFLPGLNYFTLFTSNNPTENEAWLLAVVPSEQEPGSELNPDLPYYGRLRGHLGDPRFAECEDAGRIFVVEEVTAVTISQPPQFPLISQPPAGFADWPRFQDVDLGYSLALPPGWQTEPLNHPDVLGGFWLRHTSWPDYPILVRVQAGELPNDQYEITPDLLTLQGGGGYDFAQFDVAGDWILPSSQYLEGRWVGKSNYPLDDGVAVLFENNGLVYEMGLRFPIGLQASQVLLNDYIGVVESFRFDSLPGQTGLAPTPASLEGVELLLTAVEPATVSAPTTFNVTLSGGSDHNYELYCANATWNVGDNDKIHFENRCPPWSEDAVTARQFSVDYTFPAPGRYEVSFQLEREWNALLTSNSLIVEIADENGQTPEATAAPAQFDTPPIPPPPPVPLPADYRLELTANPTLLSAPGPVQFIATLPEGDNSHCPMLDWDFFDGYGTIVTYACPGWPFTASIPRQYSISHTYAQPGSYLPQVRISHLGEVRASNSVQIEIE